MQAELEMLESPDSQALDNSHSIKTLKEKSFQASADFVEALVLGTVAFTPIALSYRQTAMSCMASRPVRVF